MLAMYSEQLTRLSRRLKITHAVLTFACDGTLHTCVGLVIAHYGSTRAYLLLGADTLTTVSVSVDAVLALQENGRGKKIDCSHSRN